jgi:ribonuclease E
MDEGRNNRIVERRVKDALKHDRARIQVGRISHFGLLEMSRQRIRTSVLESSTEKCPICGGSGHVRSVGSVTLALLRAIEEMLMKGATHNLIVRTRAEVALYVLNQKRSHLRGLEERFRITITVSADPDVVGTQAFIVDRGEQVHSAEAARELAASQPTPLAPIEDDTFVEEETEETAEVGETDAEAEAAPATDAEREDGHRRRRRRRGGRGRNGRGRDTREPSQPMHEAGADAGGEQQDPQDNDAPGEPAFNDGSDATAEDQQDGHHGAPTGDEGRDGARRRRRRGRRGGRRHRRNGENGENGGYQGQREQHGDPARSEGSSFEPGDAPAQSYSEAPAPLAAPELPPAAPESEGENPRRGSSVREPASFRRPPPDAPAPTPVVSSTGGEEQAAPKRGWWGRRLLGDK